MTTFKGPSESIIKDFFFFYQALCPKRIEGKEFREKLAEHYELSSKNFI